MSKLVFASLTGQIIGCAIAVQREPGPSVLESGHEQAMAAALRPANLYFERRTLLPIHYPSELVGEHRLGHGLLPNFASPPLTVRRVIHHRIPVFS